MCRRGWWGLSFEYMTNFDPPVAPEPAKIRTESNFSGIDALEDHNR